MIIILVIIILILELAYLLKMNKSLARSNLNENSEKFFMSYDDIIILDKFKKEEERQKEKEQRKKYTFKVSDKKAEEQKIELNEVVNEQALVNKKIAPGVYGEFAIIMDAYEATKNMSYNVELTSNNEKPRNLVFNIKGDENKYNNLEELAKKLNGSVEKNSTREIIIQWSWDYDSKDNYQDTEDGKNIENYTFAVNVIANEII